MGEGMVSLWSGRSPESEDVREGHLGVGPRLPRGERGVRIKGDKGASLARLWLFG